MGPYCKFCGRRCFVHFPVDAPPEALAAWPPGSWILATCPSGQECDAKFSDGWSWSAICAAIAASKKAAGRLEVSA